MGKALCIWDLVRITRFWERIKGGLTGYVHLQVSQFMQVSSTNTGPGTLSGRRVEWLAVRERR